MKLITVERMKQLEASANTGGYTFEKMMQKAGQGLAFIVHDRYHSTEVNGIAGLVGGGNNGGDTLVALSELQKLGWSCSALLLKADDQQSRLIEDFQSNGGALFHLDKEGFQKFELALPQIDLILDGVFGTGFSLPMRSPFDEILRKIGKMIAGKIVVAVDCPSGVDSITGEASPETLKADLTVSMEAIKDGMLKFPAFEFCGELATVELGIPAKFLKEFDNGDAIIDQKMVWGILPKRQANSHKGAFGHLIVCGGCVNYPGAPMLAARSAYRVGVGLVECVIPERIYDAAAANNPESIFTLLEDKDGVIAESASTTLALRLPSAQCMLLGPGIGGEETTQRFIQKVLFENNGGNQRSSAGFVPAATKSQFKLSTQYPPLVIDADGLRLISRIENWHKKLISPVVLTPHPGEMSALTGLSVDEIQNNRMEIARRFASEWKQVVVLKGAISIVVSPEGNLAILPFASSALAKAGTGDVLAGIIAGLMAQGVRPFEAAIAGVWIHAQAAMEVVRRQGSETCLLASDLIEAIPLVLNLD